MTYPTKAMIEAGAKAAYGTVMCDEENWPDVSGSVGAQTYRDAAKNCFLAMTDKPQAILKKVEITQDNGDGPIKIEIGNVVSFREVDVCRHVYCQGTYHWDHGIEVGKIICMLCGKEKP